ncbi:alpha/beta hydrolase [Kordiimonas sp. SCSIO 12603]|uniref:alpha/beta fold hydrolase n=1 Tax=Kordiimonas sp. SCSIO 12603 TaxID=2829596 RepID=UPI002105F5E8|nr:alpha/beta hydrolase [Kordiimonas sp. SCSIO 12603]UTW59121.1 alpha/beta hydrolase [Kordiimonas sp. SCSIO 12603]
MIRIVVVAFLAFGMISDMAKADIEQFGNKGGETLVFIPGLASSGELWQPWVKQFEATHNIFVVTAPGFAGVAPRAELDGFLEKTVEEVRSELKKNNAENVKVVGHSIGGLMSLMLANAAPEMIEKVVVVDSAPFMAGLFVAGISPDAAKTQAGYMKTAMTNMPRDAYDQQQKMGLRILSNTPEFIPTLVEWSETSDQATVATAFSEAFGTDYRDSLPTIKAEVLMLAATAEQMPLKKDALTAFYADQYSGVKNFTLQMVDDSFHFIMIDQPEVFTAALETFLK